MTSAIISTSYSKSMELEREQRAEAKKAEHNAESPYPKKGEVDHLHASPPCQGFTGLNRQDRSDNSIENNDLTKEFVNAIKYFEPKTASYENVRGLLFKKNYDYLKNLIEELLSMNYQVRWDVLNSSDYGDPQNRERVILWAAKENMVLPSIPRPTHGENLLAKRTVQDAIGCLESMEPTVFKNDDQSGKLVSLNGVAINNFCWNGSMPPEENREYLYPDQPARTIRAQPAIHYNNTRCVTVREAACLQSFPWDYQFFGSNRSQYQQVGNA